MIQNKDKKQTKIDKALGNIRRGTYIIIEARMNCHYQSIMSVFKYRRYVNDDMLKLVEKINRLSDEDFAVELVRAKKTIKARRRAQTNLK